MNQTYKDFYNVLIKHLREKYPNHPSMTAYDVEDNIRKHAPFELFKSLGQYEQDNKIIIHWCDIVNTDTMALMVSDMNEWEKQELKED